MNRVALVGGLILAGLLPLFVRDYWLYVITIGLYYAVLSTSWSVLAGQVGIISFAHAAFAAIGAYTSALIVINLSLPILIGMIVGALMAGLLGLGIGILTLRMRGPYLALTTLAFSEILRIVLTAEYGLTRGSLGLNVPIIAGGNKTVQYYMALAILVATVGALWTILNTRWGLFFKAMREDEDGAAARGVATVRYRLYAFVITSALAGFAGGFYGHVVGIVSPRLATLSEMGLILAMSIVGGLEFIVGAAAGALLLQFLSEYLRAFVEWRLAIFGLLVVLSLRFTPNGLLTALYFWLTRTTRKFTTKASSWRNGERDV